MIRWRLDLLLWIADSWLNLAKDARFADLQRLWSWPKRSRIVVMPSFTHLQRAQPIVAASEAWHGSRCSIAIYSESRNATKNFAFGDSPLGSGAIAGSSLPIDPEYSSTLLEGVDSSPLHTSSASAE